MAEAAQPAAAVAVVASDTRLLASHSETTAVSAGSAMLCSPHATEPPAQPVLHATPAADSSPQDLASSSMEQAAQSAASSSLDGLS